MISLKKLLLESKSSSFLKFYKEIERGYNPDNAILFDCLMTLREYYTDYLKWYKKYPKSPDREVIPDFTKRLQEIQIALRSDDVKKKIIAIDNGINQWHIDFPVVGHFDLDDENGSEKWWEIEELLRKLGKLPEKSPYKRKRISWIKS
jgi:hypothetical protein